MKKGKAFYKSLDDLAFEGRNKEYGAYFLRKKYNKHLVISGLVATFIYLLLVCFPIILDYFQEPAPYDGLMDDFIIYDPILYPIDDATDLAKAALPPPPQVEKIPIVVDSVPVEQKKVEEVKEEPKQEPEKHDSTSTAGSNGSTPGAGPGDDTGIYTTIDVYPRFPGGDQARFAFLRSQVRYPNAAISGNIQGVVVVVFVIEKDGSVSNLSISKGIGGGCDEEAMRVIKMMPPWEPGKRGGKPVRVLVKMPIVFRIPGKPAK